MKFLNYKNYRLRKKVLLNTKIIKFENSSIIYDLEALLRKSFCHQNYSSFLVLQSSQVQIIIEALWSWLGSFQVKPFAINFIILIFQNLCIVRTNVEEHGIGILSIEISHEHKALMMICTSVDCNNRKHE